jgi:site-specific recombinase XerC
MRSGVHSGSTVPNEDHTHTLRVRRADTHAAACTARAWSTWNRLRARLTQLGALAGNPMDGVPRAKVPRPVRHAFTDTDMSTRLDNVRDGRVPARYPWPDRASCCQAGPAPSWGAMRCRVGLVPTSTGDDSLRSL